MGAPQTMLSDLKVQSQEIVRHSFNGMTPHEIAVKLNKPVDTITRTLRNPMAKAMLQKLSDQANETVIDVRKRLAQMNIHALDTIESILTNGITKNAGANPAPASVRLAAAKDTLDRTGYKAPDRVEHLHGHFTADDLQALKERQNHIREQFSNAIEIGAAN